jgi:uncharacterized protein
VTGAARVRGRLDARRAGREDAAVLRSSSVRALDDRDAPQVLDLLGRDPVANVFVAARVEAVGCDPRRLGGELWGWFEKGRLASLCWSGANLVPVEANEEAASAFAARAARGGRRCSSLVGPAGPVLAMWEQLRPHWGEARDVRDHQPLMVCDTDPLVDPDPAVRRADGQDLDVLVPACVAMFTEEVGYSPVTGDGGAGYRARVAELVSAGHAYVRMGCGPLGPRVEFKAELGAVTRDAVQVQGVWVHPDLRGQGLSEPGMAAVVSLARKDGPAVVSLYVNDYNVRALAAYRRVGFREVGAFATVLF